jgi:hypothetical protein
MQLRPNKILVNVQLVIASFLCLGTPLIMTFLLWTDPPKKAVEFWQLVGICAICVLSFPYLLWETYKPLKIVFYADRMCFPTLRGVQIIYWTQIESAMLYPAKARIFLSLKPAHSKQIVIPIDVYKNATELLSNLKDWLQVPIEDQYEVEKRLTT